jgi:hypothetical protein
VRPGFGPAAELPAFSQARWRHAGCISLSVRSVRRTQIELLKSRGMSTTIRDSRESIEAWSLRPYLPDSLRNSVAAADILVVPTEGYVDRADLRFFPSGTTDFVEFIEANVPSGTAVEVCIGETDYCEVARHSDELYAAAVVVKLLAAPLFVNLLAEYIKRKVGKKAPETTLKTTITFEDQQAGRAFRLDYDGPANAFETTALKAVRQIQAGGPLEINADDGQTSERPRISQALPTPRRKKRRK